MWGLWIVIGVALAALAVAWFALDSIKNSTLDEDPGAKIREDEGRYR